MAAQDPTPTTRWAACSTTCCCTRRSSARRRCCSWPRSARRADLLVGCTGGGSNFGGLMFPFLREKWAGRMSPMVRAVEPAACPSLTQGDYALRLRRHRRDDPADEDAHARPRLRARPDPRRRPALPRDEPADQPPLRDRRDRGGRQAADRVLRRRRRSSPAPRASCRRPSRPTRWRPPSRRRWRCKETGEEKVILTALCGHGHLDLAGVRRLPVAARSSITTGTTPSCATRSLRPSRSCRLEWADRGGVLGPGPEQRPVRQGRPERGALPQRRSDRRLDPRRRPGGRGHRRRDREPPDQRRRRGPAGRGGARPALPGPGEDAPDRCRRVPRGVGGPRAAVARDRRAGPRGCPPSCCTSGSTDEWSFIETLRHLVFATDAWVRPGDPGRPVAVGPARPAPRRDGRRSRRPARPRTRGPRSTRCSRCAPTGWPPCGR